MPLPVKKHPRRDQSGYGEMEFSLTSETDLSTKIPKNNLAKEHDPEEQPSTSPPHSPSFPVEHLQI